MTAETAAKTREAANAMTEEEKDAMERDQPEKYEVLRAWMAANAPTLDEFLNWATVAEIEADTDTEDPGAVVEQSAGGNSIEVEIHRGSQTLDATGGGFNLHGVRVATGRPGHGTPGGCHTAFSAERSHWSRKYHAPMPYSVFFIAGIALHQGDVGVKSHGCIHLTQSLAKSFYDAYNAGKTIHVCVD